MDQKKAGVIISYAGQLVQILSGLIYTPFMLRLLGQSEYGLYQLVFSVVSYLSLFSLGFGSSYMRFYAREKANDDENGIAKINGMFFVIFLVISFISALAGLFMINNITMIFGNGLTSDEYRVARVLMALMVFNLAITFPNSIFDCIITANERFLFQKTLILFKNILNPFITIPLLISGYGSIGMVLVTSFLTLLVFGLNIYYCLNKLHARFDFKNMEFSLLKEMWLFTFFIFLNQIVDQINWSVDKFLLGRLAGTTAVAVYGVGGQINTLYLQFSSSVSNVFIPKVNKIVAETGDDNELTKLFTKVGRVQFIIMALILSGFTFFGKPFVRFWAGEGYDVSYYVTLLLIFPVTVPLIQNLGIEIQRAKNKHKARSIVYFFIAIANIFVSIPLIKWFGPSGAALGTTLSLAVGNIGFMNWYYHHRLGINVFYFWKNILSFVPGLVLPIIFGILNLIFINYDSIIKLGFGVILYTVIYCLSMYKFGMNVEEQRLINEPLRKMLKR